MAGLIIDAYKVKKFQIAGLPGWGDSGHDLYDVEAKLPDSAAATPDEARLMLQSLLADRFQLRLHHETRPLPVYALRVSKKGFKLISDQKVCFAGSDGKAGSSRNKRGAGGSETSDDAAKSFRWPWAFYVQALSVFTDRPIIDESGLEGAGYCTAEGQGPLAALAIENVSRNGAGPSVYSVLEDKWGVVLQPKKAQMDVVVIDNVQRPSGN